MQKGNFCPLCGKTAGPFVKAICLDCHLKKSCPVRLPEKIQFQRCKNCGKTMLLGKMLPMDDSSLKAIVDRQVKTKELSGETREISLEMLPNGNIAAKVKVSGFIGDVPAEVEKETILMPKTVNCDSCMRLASNYFEATIQLRAKEKGARGLEKVLRRLDLVVKSQREKDGLAAITGIAKKPNGFDVTIGSKKAACAAVTQLRREFGGETKMSHTLIGVDKSGRQKKRFTFLLRV